MAADGQSIERKIISVTDIHFDPFYDPSLAKELAMSPYRRWDAIFSKIKEKTPSAYNTETNPFLFQKILSAMKRKSNGISAVVFAGDILAHNFNDMITKYIHANSDYERNDFIHKTIGYVSMKLNKTFPNVPIYFSLGNNDAYNGDYKLADDGEFLHANVDLFFENFIKKPKSRTEFYSTFPVHGYYSVPFPAVHHGRFIGLNTIFFSTRYTAIAGGPPGKTELDWLEKELAKAKQAEEKVWLLLHIPPGVNVYSTQRDSTQQRMNVSLFWQTDYNQRYLELIRKYGDVIVSSFAGHTHMDDFRLIYGADKENKRAVDFIHISASVSPVFGNNPAFQVIRFNPRSGTPTDTVTYYMDLSKSPSAFKQEYTYVETYNTTPDLTGLQTLYPTLSEDPNNRNSYIEFYPVRSKKSDISDVWQWYWCGIGNLTSTAYITACKQLP